MIKFFLRLFKHDILRKFVALFFAILLYLTVSERIGSESRFDNVPVEIDYPEGVINTDKKEIVVNVDCSGSKRMIEALRDGLLKGKAKISIQNYVEGRPYILRLNEDNFRVPLGVKLLRIEPREIVLNLESRKSKLVKVIPQYNMSKLASDYLISSIRITPNEVNIIGPASIINSLDEIKTIEIPLDNSVRDDFDYQANLNLPENVSAVPSTVNCNIMIKKEFGLKNIPDVPIHLQMNSNDTSQFKYSLSQKFVKVQVYGSISDVERTSVNKLRAFVEIGSISHPGIYDVEVKCFTETQGSLKIREIIPKKVQLIVQ